MKSSMWVLIAPLVMILALSTFKVAATEVNFTAMQGLGAPDYYLVHAKQLKQDYHIYVRVPPNYDKSKKYPAVYLLDGGLTFPLLASYYHYMSFTQEMPDMLIVGISYGSDSYKTGNNRSRDFTAKSKERSYWGGAANFQLVLAKQIIPLIEQNYAVDKTKRIVFGQSLGGQFVLHTVMNMPDLFHGYISSNPALHRNLDLFLQDKIVKATSDNKPRLFVASGSEDDERFRIPASKWIKHWTNKEKLPWQMKVAILDGQSHLSAAPEAFRSGIKWILRGND